MDVCLLFLAILMMNGNGLCQQETVCLRSVINSCSDCIRSGPYCVWCKQLNFTRAGEQEAVRCDTRAQLLKRNCSLDEIISPQNNMTIIDKKPLSTSLNNQEPVQLSPQKISLKLRPRLSSTFPVSFKRVQGYPVDLYYLMDLSNSMKDDLEKVKGLGQDLFRALSRITAQAQIGFGAFVDKTVLPYTNTNEKKLQRPCDEDDQQCQAVFGYRHVLSMTPSAEEFREKVKQQFISGNLDSPEGSLDAMMQAAVCGDQIGWRNRSTRLIVLTTDAGFHMAGDGKLAGILEPNDERCYMKNSLYAKSSTMDYPSVGQLAMQLEKNNIQPIFAVTKNVEIVYKQLSRMIPQSEVGVLSDDSSNVVQLIQAAYNRLSSKVTVTHENLPNHVRVVYTPRCKHPGPSGDVTGVCDNVKENEEISFDVTVTADSCIQGKTFTIRPLGIKDTLTVTLSTECECECNDPRGQTHSHCNGNGGINCGICRCGEGSVGQFCECSVDVKDELTLQASCQRNNGTECEGRGECVCGRCKCFSIGSGQSFYYGDFCECDNQNCGRAHNKLCAGNGTCNCGRCECNPGFEGSACQCNISTVACLTANNTVCNDRGSCKCSRCECFEGYKGPKCKECHGCPDPCQTKLNCIECLGFKSGHFKNNCSTTCSKSVSHRMVNQFTQTTKKECLQKDSEGCWIKFKMEQLVGLDNYMAEILTERACPDPPNVTAIIGGSIASVALIGILLLMLIKLLIYMKDLKEFRRFENEKKKSKWAKADNPLFQTATTTVTNPTFTGE